MLFREIQMFRAVMTAGSTSKAAQLLNVSQPAVSQALARLEEHAGLPLFQRVRGKLNPTQEAVALLAEVNRFFVGMEAIEHRIRSLKGFGAGRIRIAALPGVGLGFLPRVLSKLNLVERQVSVSLQVMGSAEVRERLLAQECDLGLMAEEVPVSGLEHSVFARYNGVVALPPGHPLTHHAVLGPADLAAYPMIGLNPEDSATRQLDALFMTHGVTPNTIIETPYSVSICELVRHGLGVAIVNPVTAFDYADRGVVLRPFSETLSYACILAMPPGQPLSDFARQLLSEARIQLEADLAKLQGSMEPMR